MHSAPVREPYNPLPMPGNINPAGYDRRFPYLNGGGRNPPVTYHGIEYRPAFCCHGWVAQQRQPLFLKNTDRAFFGCRGYVSEHEQADDWDCGYKEEGVCGRECLHVGTASVAECRPIFLGGVRSIQVLNPFWDSGPWPFPNAGEWYYRQGKLVPGTVSLPASPNRDKTSASASGHQGSQASPSQEHRNVRLVTQACKIDG